MDLTNTPDEIVDVVDENDNVIGQATKGEVNSNPNVIHREVGVLIFDAQGRILIQQRSRKKKMYPLWWMISVAGHVPAGMSPEQSAHKELQEELGFDTNLVQYEKILLKYPTENFFSYGYIGKFSSGVQIEIDSNETEDFKFVNESELDKMIKNGDKIEEYSLADFRKFFKGEFDHLIK